MNRNTKTWFEHLMGFEEQNIKQIHQNIQIQGNSIKSIINGNSFQFGYLEIPTLAGLRQKSVFENTGKTHMTEEVGNVRDYHLLNENQNALFQAASQFNLLEMINPEITPEYGISGYQYDKTQGPVCAIACGAGTIYRNYFVKLEQQIGQSENKQIDCLDRIGEYFSNETQALWNMKNGYALANQDGLERISTKINSLNHKEYEYLKGLLKVGIQWETEVTISSSRQIVNQIYCSALPVGYSHVDQQYWKEFAVLILDATYEATLHTALINKQKTGNNKVFLTLVGGGVFGNKPEWLVRAISKNLDKFSNESLEIVFISYGNSNPLVREILARYQ